MTVIRIIHRLALALPLALGVVLVAFFYLRALPGDPVAVILSQSAAESPQAIATLRAQLHLNEPLLSQLAYFLANLVHGSLGYSFVQHVPVSTLIGQALPATIELGFGALAFAALIGIPLGVIGGWRRAGTGDRIGTFITILAVSLPEFWLGLVLIVVLAAYLKWLPAAGEIGVAVQLRAVTGMPVLDALLTGNVPALMSALRHLILPSVALGTPMVAVITRVLSASLHETKWLPYITVARAKGLTERQVLLRHALRNAWIPTVTVTGLNFGILLGGNMVVETVFAWPGLGRLVVQSIFSRDYPVVQGAILVYGLTFILINLLVDVVVTLLNPQVTL
ncbi:MAG: ABC transporter permease [Firmicutes bacterium]|nr:ABC transporter permease [Bacillota bacterium]